MVVGVQGAALDFQNPSDFIQQMECKNNYHPTSCSWIESATGDNNLLQTNGCNQDYVVATSPLVMTYSAANLMYGTHMVAYLLDVNGDLIYNGGTPAICGGQYSWGVGRYELKMNGGYCEMWKNGVLIETSSVTFPQNPHYVAWHGWWQFQSICYAGGYGGMDDIVWGDLTPRYVFGMPENGYFIMKDVLNPAASGFYKYNISDPSNPTLIYSNYFHSTFSKPWINDEIVTFDSPTGGTQLTQSTGTVMTGTLTWNLTQFFAQNPAYGLYRTGINPQTNSSGFATSAWLPYIGSGATINFDKNSYAVGETASITVTVSNNYYTALHNYNVTIQDIYGTQVFTDTSLSFTQLPSLDWQATTQYTWTDANVEGVYFGLIYADLVSDNTHVLMNYATTGLSSNLIIDGYVKDGETTNIISGASVNVTQGSDTDALTSGIDGNYTTGIDFSANAPTTIVASAAGYETYSTTFTPLYAGEIEINITLMPTTPTFSGIALGGIVRTPPYNRTVDSAMVTINKTGVGNYVVTTNSAGYYIQNTMTNGTIWDVWGSKTGYANSSIYQKLVFGI